MNAPLSLEERKAQLAAALVAAANGKGSDGGDGIIGWASTKLGDIAHASALPAANIWEGVTSAPAAFRVQREVAKSRYAAKNAERIARIVEQLV
jgi:hypothetical protein